MNPEHCLIEREGHVLTITLNRPEAKNALAAWLSWCSTCSRSSNGDAVALGGRTSAESYLDIDKILDAARETGADAVHPGYGFLAERAGFARSVEEAGLTFVGPTPEAIDAMGDKIRARQAAEKAGVPVLPSAPVSTDEGANRAAAETLGFPVLVKAAAGGGGKGMRRVRTDADLVSAWPLVRGEAHAAFGDDRVYVERAIEEPRHIEAQIVADAHGRIVCLGERECSVQRRHQKLLEETPSPALDDRQRAANPRANSASSRATPGVARTRA